MGNEPKGSLFGLVTATSGILAGAGLATLTRGFTGFDPYILVSGGFAGGVAIGGVAAGVAAVLNLAGNVDIKEPKAFAKKMLAYTVLSSALVSVGTSLGKDATRVRSVSIPAQTGSIERVLVNHGRSEKPLYEYGTNNSGKVFLPRTEILRLESEKLRKDQINNLKKASETYK